MAEYWGAAAIAARLAIHQTTLYDWYRRDGFLMCHRRRLGRTTMWWTNDALIFAWERTRCLKQLAEYRARGGPRRRRAAPPPVSQGER